MGENARNAAPKEEIAEKCLSISNIIAEITNGVKLSKCIMIIDCKTAIREKYS